MPPWAQALALSARVSLVRTIARRPSEASLHAVQRPAMPVPTMTGRGEIMGGNIWEIAVRDLIPRERSERGTYSAVTKTG
jgi:hypothetical protein